jgi:hypothetical protein
VKNLALLFLFFVPASAFSQEVIIKKNALSRNIAEEYEVLKTDRKVRNGACKIYHGTTLVGTGKYAAGKRVGRWLFYDQDSIQQVYNYDTRKLQFNRPPAGVSFEFDKKPGDTVSNPAILEGSLGQSKLLLSYFPVEMLSHEGTFQVVHYLSISETGELLKWDYKIISPEWNSAGTRNLTGIEKEIQSAFIPAAVNKHPVKSTIIMVTRMTNTKSIRTIMEVRTPVSSLQTISPRSH